MKKKLLCLLLILTTISAFLSCSTNDDNKKDKEKIIDQTLPDDETDDVDIPDSEPMSGTVELNLYTIDYETYECIPTVSVIKDTDILNAETIVNEVIINFRENVNILKITTEDKKVFVTIDPNGAPVNNVSEEMETAMLDCISYSILDNLDVEEVYFRTSADRYESNYLVLEKDEPYVFK